MHLKLSCDFLCTALLKYKSKISTTTRKSKRGGGMDIEMWLKIYAAVTLFCGPELQPELLIIQIRLFY